MYRCRVNAPSRSTRRTSSKRDLHRPPLTNQVISEYLYEYDDCRWSDVPKWLRLAILGRNLSFGPRNPSESEKMEAEQDGMLHRNYTNQLTPHDLYLKYVKGVKYDV